MGNKISKKDYEITDSDIEFCKDMSSALDMGFTFDMVLKTVEHRDKIRKKRLKNWVFPIKRPSCQECTDDSGSSRS